MSSPRDLYKIVRSEYKECVEFCSKWHYSGTCPPGKEYFKIIDKHSSIIGVCVYGEPAGRNQKSCYDSDLELRRLCCIDDTPKNTESFFIGGTIRVLKKSGKYKSIISLADPEHGHCGIIYKASNFELLGEEKGGGSRTIVIDGVKMHSKTAYAKYGKSGLKGLREVLPNSNVQVVNRKRKMVYRYKLRK